MNIDFLKHSIDLNMNGVIDTERERSAAISYGIQANIGENIETVLNRAKNNKDIFKKKLEEIDKTQTVDNKNVNIGNDNNQGIYNQPNIVSGTEKVENNNNGLMHIDPEDLRKKRFFAIG